MPLHSDQWPSTRYRVHAYVERLGRYGIEAWVVQPTYPSVAGRASYLLRLAGALLRADVIVLQKKIFRRPLYALIRMCSRRRIFDFDDAIYVFPDTKDLLPEVLRDSAHVVVGNRHLEAYARRYARHVTRLPTPIDCERYHVRSGPGLAGTVTIGWIGMGGNLGYLRGLEPVFQALYEARGAGVQLKVISDAEFRFSACPCPVVNVPWHAETELEELRLVDIGIMPLTDDEFSRGKCAFKALQYMGMGIPAVVSAVGMNAEVITDGVNGFLASTTDEWVRALLRLVDDPSLRERLGQAGRRTVESDYSYETLTPRLASLLHQVAGEAA